MLRLEVLLRPSCACRRRLHLLQSRKHLRAGQEGMCNVLPQNAQHTHGCAERLLLHSACLEVVELVTGHCARAPTYTNPSCLLDGRPLLWLLLPAVADERRQRRGHVWRQRRPLLLVHHSVEDGRDRLAGEGWGSTEGLQDWDTRWVVQV